MGLMLGDEVVSSSFKIADDNVTLTRISDDSGKEIGTWYMNFTDGDGVTYKVICLDAAYRNASCQWLSDKVAITNMPMYNHDITANGSYVWGAKETATKNCDLIKAFCDASVGSDTEYTSAAVTHCRSKSFIIGGSTYYGQLPNIKELINISANAPTIESIDITASSSSDLTLKSLFNHSHCIWSSNQCLSNSVWFITYMGGINDNSKNLNYAVAPVLEIPL